MTENARDYLKTTGLIVGLLLAGTAINTLAIVSKARGEVGSQYDKPIATRHGKVVIQRNGKRYTGHATLSVEPRTRAAARRLRGASVSPFTNRDCLDGPTRALLNNLEARFGKVALVKVCVPGARMPSGQASWHGAKPGRAFDFKVPKGVDQRDVMVWLTKHSPGVTISYRGALAGIIHTDTGTFRQVIYRAASHEAGERAVAIWKERTRLASLHPPQTPPKPTRERLDSMWTMTAAFVDPDFESFVHPPTDRAPDVPVPERRVAFWHNDEFVKSKDVVVLAHTTLTCPNGKAFPPKLAQLPKDAAAHFGKVAYINSGYRTPERNRRVGGARNSEHKKCKAIDWRVPGVSIADLRRWVVARLDKYGIGGLGTYGSHLHTDARKATRLVTWNGGRKKSATRYAKHRKPTRYAAG